MQILLVDNNDSFTYNIVALLRETAGIAYKVIRADALDPVRADMYDKFIFSPGPGQPHDFPILHDLLDQYKETKSILGICLGHQAICTYFGGQLVPLDTVVHGQKHTIKTDSAHTYLFSGIPAEINVGLYHSWVVDIGSVPECLKITGVSRDDVLMSVSHREYDIHGVQYHPESFMTVHGKRIIHNFLRGSNR